MLSVFDGLHFSVFVLAYSPDGKYLAGACGNHSGADAGEVKIWEASSGREVATLGGYTACLWSVSFSPDGTRLATASGRYATGKPQDAHGEVRVWDMIAGQELISLREEATVFGVAYSPDGKRLAVCGTNKDCRDWG